MRTQLMGQFHQKVYDNITDEIDSLRRSRDKNRKSTIKALESVWKLIDQTMQQEDAIIVSSDALEFIDEYLRGPGERPPAEWVLPEVLPETGLWVELEEELKLNDWPFEIKAFQLSEMGSRALNRLGMQSAHQLRQEKLRIEGFTEKEMEEYFELHAAHAQTEKELDELMWELSVINMDCAVEFSLNYFAASKEWNTSPDCPPCPFSICSKWEGGRRCKQCRELRIIMALFFATILAARRGEFQEVTYREPSPVRRERSQDHPTDRRDAPDIIVDRIDIKKKTVYVTPDKEDEAEARLHWKEIHSEEEIEAIKKAARKHVRRYKDGRVVEVKESRPRNYWRLKSERITRLE